MKNVQQAYARQMRKKDFVERKGQHMGLYAQIVEKSTQERHTCKKEIAHEKPDDEDREISVLWRHCRERHEKTEQDLK